MTLNMTPEQWLVITLSILFSTPLLHNQIILFNLAWLILALLIVYGLVRMWIA